MSALPFFTVMTQGWRLMNIKKIAVQNRELLYYDWIPEQFDSIVLAIQGLGACANRYTWLAEYLSGTGIAVVALELDGFGESPGMPGYVKNYEVWVHQLGLMHEHLKRTYPGKKIALLGESLGAMIVTRYIEFADTDKAILLSPAYVEGNVFSLPDKMKAGIGIIFNPKLHITLPYTHRDFCNSAEGLNYLVNSKKELTRVTAKLSLAMMLLQMALKKDIENISTPVFALQAANDRLVNNEATKKILDRIPSIAKYKQYENSHHSLCIDANREQVFADIAEFVGS